MRYMPMPVGVACHREYQADTTLRSELGDCSQCMCLNNHRWLAIGKIHLGQPTGGTA